MMKWRVDFEFEHLFHKKRIIAEMYPNHLAPKHQLRRAQKLVNSFMQGVILGDSPALEQQGPWEPEPSCMWIPATNFQQQLDQVKQQKSCHLNNQLILQFFWRFKEFLRDELAIIRVFCLL